MNPPQDNLKKEIIRTDTLLCIKCGNLINIDEVALMYEEQAKSETLKKVLKIIDECDCDENYRIWVIQFKQKLKDLEMKR